MSPSNWPPSSRNNPREPRRTSRWRSDELARCMETGPTSDDVIHGRMAAPGQERPFAFGSQPPLLPCDNGLTRDPSSQRRRHRPGCRQPLRRMIRSPSRLADASPVVLLAHLPPLASPPVSSCRRVRPARIRTSRPVHNSTQTARRHSISASRQARRTPMRAAQFAPQA